MDAYERKLFRKLTGVGVRDAVVYHIEAANGDVVYIGVTNNLRWRAAEHLAQGPKWRPSKPADGRLPERNRTPDGK